MNVRLAELEDQDSLIQLIAEFRVTMSRFRGSAPPLDLPAAERKALSYLLPEYQVFVAESEDGALAAFMVCHIEAGHVSIEALFVLPDHRRQGVGSLLYDQAEFLALELGEEPISNWVHPNNDRYIAFLRNRGYLVLSLIELRKPRSGEGPLQQIKVGKNIFEYCC
ncbi:MAG: GNAT family N-acetyltransferase [Chloroflexota bacterium]|nr:MAG: GNAT family N-acetyltransferase [Chloroflexota bacterium]